MFTVALIGADGAGKTTVARRLATATNGLRIRYLYMGINPEASNRTLPTTKLVQSVKRRLGRPTHQGGPPDPSRSRAPRGLLARAGRTLKSNVRLANQMAEEWYRQGLAWWYRRRGWIVLFDRHFLSDYFAHDVGAHGAGRPLLGRLHGFMLRRLYPRPDLMILLDAPGSVLHARKPEGTVELLEARRREYLALREALPHVEVVDAGQPCDAVVRQVVAAIGRFDAQRTGGKP